MGRLDGKTIAVLVTDGFEEVELTEPKKAIEREGGCAVIVSPKHGKVRGWNRTDWGSDHAVDHELSKTDHGPFDALLLPGGVMSPDRLRTDPAVARFVRSFFDAGKPVAAICHGPWTLIEADVVKGRRMTSYPSLKTDLRNAGARWVDEEVVVDQGLVTSRRPDDLPAFCARMVELFAQGAPSPTA